MKATDLMIGDYVTCKDSNQYPECPILQVNGLVGDEPYDIYISENGSDELDIYGEEDIQPIPLTKEILEKNGFTDCETSDLDRGMGNSFWYPGEENCISDSDLMINLMRHSFLVRNNASTIFGLHHVHELQHALRLCGIEKQIVL